ncbi:DNA-binding response regulator [Sphingobacterium mizutaii NBRC 14946 = DSM 11724]|uniref:Response regulator uvrY n=2 Tax=Sphingobacterium mizutaii TaxID=1010 RepID=A0AAJ5C1J3_9SPHI|nr:response regulator transcription factor [Sphingobacterium mizutaii]GEM69116.1 DNA-binding response regulator [Sphingobacterium mizutaii NBRC 14946 = DSM 11724]SDL86301.1 DNA-binding response regulator, NarL/FixJ family, contains REC and HTH domains [Sphingobacterium mizutaii]SNV55584.1 Response regulator uvrY [Sphingobacterium mizutaii]
MSEGRKTLALVDDHPIVIEGLKSVLSKWNGQYDLICFSNGLSILNYLHDNHIDIVLLDISLPDINGLEVCKKIKTESPRTKVVGLSNQAEYNVISMMLENGASGFLLKEVPSHEIMEGLDQVVKGETALSAEVKNILASQSKQTQSLPSLTKREKQLIQLLAKGKTTSKIATELSLSKFTVDTYRKNLLQKFNVKNSSELLVLLIENKMI